MYAAMMNAITSHPATADAVTFSVAVKEVNAWRDAMTRASGSDKANELAKAGRFGLGQKSLFNLCDAFIVQGWLGDTAGTVEHRIVNPYVALGYLDDTDGSILQGPKGFEIFGQSQLRAAGKKSRMTIDTGGLLHMSDASAQSI